jgi:hypothetical protein
MRLLDCNFGAIASPWRGSLWMPTAVLSPEMQFHSRRAGRLPPQVRDIRAPFTFLGKTGDGIEARLVRDVIAVIARRPSGDANGGV